MMDYVIFAILIVLLAMITFKLLATHVKDSIICGIKDRTTAKSHAQKGIILGTLETGTENTSMKMQPTQPQESAIGLANHATLSVIGAVTQPIIAYNAGTIII